MKLRLGGRVVAVCMGMLTTSCAPTQLIPIDTTPGTLSVFVDGHARELDAPTKLKLRSDKDHTLFFKHPGYRPQLVILHSGPEDACRYKRQLEPAELSLQLQPLHGRSLELEIEKRED